jgi:hypothetical protein
LTSKEEEEEEEDKAPVNKWITKRRDYQHQW